MTLGQQGDRRLLGIEFTHRSCAVRTIERPRCHANHLIHDETRGERQIITASSDARQRRSDELVSNAVGRSLNPLDILWDEAVPGLPIYRTHHDDPDGENTLATAVFEIGSQSVRWRVYDEQSDTPCFTLEGTATPC